MNLREAAQQALEALQYGSTTLVEVAKNRWESRADLAIDALRAALEQMPLEPDIAKILHQNLWNLYAEEPEQEPGFWGRVAARQSEKIKQLETALDELKQHEQEPVAWIDDSGHPKHLRHWQSSTENHLYGPLRPLYTHSPRREWQGLTEEEIRDLWSWSATAEAERTATTQQHAFARAIEAALKEKNNG